VGTLLSGGTLAEYQKTLIVYLDIMGFKKLIEESQRVPTKVDAIIDILKKTKERAAITYPRIVSSRVSVDAMEARNFSDLIVRVTPIGVGPISLRQAVEMECLILTSVQCELFLESGILLRGAMCVGDLYCEKDIVFGPALVNAYQLEESIAVFPRIVIDAKSCMLHGAAESDLPRVEQFIQRGEDGAYFIDYLHSVYINMFALSQFKTSETQLLDVHKMQIEMKLQELSGKDDRLKQKGLWLALYHNSVLKRLMAENPDKKDRFMELMISEARLKI
jgi:hypothetical protein